MRLFRPIALRWLACAAWLGMLVWQLPSLGRAFALDVGRHHQVSATLNPSHGANSARMALKIFRSILEKDPAQLSALDGLVQMNFIEGDLDLSRKVLVESSLAGTHRGSLSWLAFANLALDRGNVELAMEGWEQSDLFNQPDSLGLVSRNANMLWDAGNHEAAQRLYLVAANLEGGKVEDYRNLGNMLETRTGDILSASRMFEKVVQLEPHSASDWLHLAYLYEQIEQWDQALEAASTALLLQPDLDGAMCEIGWIMSVQGRQGEALAKLETYLKTYPQSPAVLTLLGSFYLGEGLISKAESSLVQALQYSSPGSPLEAWTQSLLGKVALRSDDYAQAEQRIKRAVEIMPENVSYLLQLGDLYILMQQVDKANGLYQRIMNMNPTPAQIAHIQQQLSQPNSP